MDDDRCEYVGCERDGEPVDLPHATTFHLCPRHRIAVRDAVEARLPVEIVPPDGDRRRLRVKRQADWTREDWELRYYLLERPGHRIEILNAWFRPRRVDVPPEQLLCSCGWRGDYLQWPAHAIGGDQAAAAH
jgi:hypothetical protein